MNDIDKALIRFLKEATGAFSLLREYCLMLSLFEKL